MLQPCSATHAYTSKRDVTPRAPDLLTIKQASLRGSTSSITRRATYMLQALHSYCRNVVPWWCPTYLDVINGGLIVLCLHPGVHQLARLARGAPPVAVLEGQGSDPPLGEGQAVGLQALRLLTAKPRAHHHHGWAVQNSIGGRMRMGGERAAAWGCKTCQHWVRICYAARHVGFCKVQCKERLLSKCMHVLLCC